MSGPSYIDDNGEVQYGWKTPFNHNTRQEALNVSLHCKDASMTQQHFKEECDINNIVERYHKTGEIKLIPQPPIYGDFTTAEDYHTYQNRLAETNALFYKLPAQVRASYLNDPGRWLQDVTTRLESGDLEPLRLMGLDVPEPKQELPDTPKAGTPPATTPAPEPPKAAS